MKDKLTKEEAQMLEAFRALDQHDQHLAIKAAEALRVNAEAKRNRYQF